MQSKKSAILEALVNQVVGFSLIYIAQIIYFAAVGLEIPTKKHIGLMIISTIISISKHYAIRRWFQRRGDK